MDGRGAGDPAIPARPIDRVRISDHQWEDQGLAKGASDRLLPAGIPRWKADLHRPRIAVDGEEQSGSIAHGDWRSPATGGCAGSGRVSCSVNRPRREREEEGAAAHAVD